MSDRQREVDALLRLQLHSFFHKSFLTLEPGTSLADSWTYQHLTWKLEKVRRGELKRLIINVPPRSGKSHLASVAFPMFVLGHDPAKRFICISHTEELARKFSIDRRLIARSPWFRRLFPAFDLRTNRDMELVTADNGVCFASGVGGAVLGKGADIIVIDDPIKGLAVTSKAERRRVNEFYDNTLITRLNDKTQGAIVLIMQRLHQEDLCGHVMEKDDWEVVTLPAIAPEDRAFQLSDDPHHLYRRRAGEVLHPTRDPLEVLEQMRRVQGSMLFQAQYQQEPVPAGGAVIKSNWLRFYDERPACSQTIVSWDTASTLGERSDYSVGSVWGLVGSDYYLLDLVRGKFESPDLKRKIVELSTHWRADQTMVEDTELGRAMAQDIRFIGSHRVQTSQPDFDKESRLLAQAAKFECGQVHLPREAAWLGDYIAELTAFPNGKHDDQVDSTSQALRHLGRQAFIAEPTFRREVGQRRTIERRRTISP